MSRKIKEDYNKIKNELDKFKEKEDNNSEKENVFIKLDEEKSEKSKKKIKEEIVLEYPNPARELIKYLKEKKLIDQNVNPVCDTLSKDI